MAARHAACIVEERIGVELVVAQEFPDVSVKLIRSALDRGVDHGAGRRAEFRRESARLNAKLLQRVRRRLNRLHRTLLQVGRAGIVVDAVEREVILRFEVPVRAQPIRGLIVGIGEILLNAGFEQSQIGVAATIQRQIADLFFLHDTAHISGLRLQQRRLGLHLQHLGDVAELQRKVDRRPRLHVDFDVLLDLRRETLSSGLDGIDARRNGDELILAGTVGDRGSCNGGCIVGERDRRAGHDGSAGVADRTDDRSGVNLRERMRSEDDAERRWHKLHRTPFIEQMETVYHR